MSWDRTTLISHSGVQIPIYAGLEFDHAQIHLGHGFTHSSLHTSLAAAASLDHVLLTGNFAVHLRLASFQASNAPGTVLIYEGPTTSGGSTGTIMNRNRVSTKTSQCTITEAPTVTDVGTQLDVAYLPAASNQSGLSDDLGRDEIILKPNTKYLFRYTNGDNNSVDLVARFFWYEPKNNTTAL
jgi:hypothetical protein